MSLQALLLVLAALSFYSEGLSVDPRQCRQQLTCGQCQAVSPECSWCSDENYSWDRCDRFDYQARSQCNRRNIVNHTSSFTTHRERPISNTVTISPQYTQARLYKGRSASVRVKVKVTDNDLRRRKVSLRPREVPGVQVEISSDCPGFDSSTKACPRIRSGQVVEFALTLTATGCQGRQRLRVGSPGVRGRTIRIDITSKCQCDCENQLSTDEIRCNDNGRFSCGVCQCYRGWYGPECDCDVGPGDGQARCRATNSSRICSGRGQCICGECSCSNTAASRHRFYGDYCQCNNYNCPFHNGQLCGGSEMGQCVCGRCICNDGHRGQACEQSTDTSTCLSRNGLICNDKGTCLGGLCRCEGTYRGATCEECPTCMGRCAVLKNCVLCHAFQSGPLNRQQCLEQCSYANIELVDIVNPTEAGVAFCTFVDDDDGSFFFFVYRVTGPEEVKVQRNKVFAGR